MAIAWVNGATADGGTNPASMALTVSLTPGNYVIIGVALPTGGSVSSITDNSVTPGTYGRVSFQTVQLDVEMWVGLVPSTAPTTITVNLAGSPATGFAVLGQYSGFYGPSGVGTTASSAGSTTPGSGLNKTTLYANDFVISVLGWNISAAAPSIAQANGIMREDGNSTGAVTKVGAALVDNTSATAGTSLNNDVTLGNSESSGAVIMELFTLTPNLSVAVPSGGAGVYAGWPNSTVLVMSTFQVTDAPTYVVLSVQRPTPFNPEGSPIIVDA